MQGDIALVGAGFDVTETLCQRVDRVGAAGNVRDVATPKNAVG